MPGIIIRPRARILHGHDWVYNTEVLKIFGNPQDGDVISIKDGRDRMLGSAIYHSQSQIVARRFSHQRQELDRDFFVRRIERAQEYRDRIGIDPSVRRVVWSESDGLPGVIINRYNSVAILQTVTLAMDQRRDLIAAVGGDVAAGLEGGADTGREQGGPGDLAVSHAHRAAAGERQFREQTGTGVGAPAETFARRPPQEGRTGEQNR